jgi:hypothetical protein
MFAREFKSIPILLYTCIFSRFICTYRYIYNFFIDYCFRHLVLGSQEPNLNRIIQFYKM